MRNFKKYIISLSVLLISGISFWGWLYEKNFLLNFGAFPPIRPLSSFCFIISAIILFLIEYCRNFEEKDLLKSKAPIVLSCLSFILLNIVFSIFTYKLNIPLFDDNFFELWISNPSLKLSPIIPSAVSLFSLSCISFLSFLFLLKYSKYCCFSKITGYIVFLTGMFGIVGNLINLLIKKITGIEFWIFNPINENAIPMTVSFILLLVGIFFIFHCDIKAKD